MANFFIDHLQSGSGANDGSSGTGSWWGYSPAFVEANVSGTGVEPGDYIWARRVVSGSPAGELIDAGTSQINATLRGTPLDLVHVIRWPESSEPDYLNRPSGSMADWDSDGASVHPIVRLDGSTGPLTTFSFSAVGNSDFIRLRGMEIWSGSGGDRLIQARSQMWFEDVRLFGAEGSLTQSIMVTGGTARFRDCILGHDTEVESHALGITQGGVAILNDCVWDTAASNRWGTSFGAGNVFMRNELDNTRAGTGVIAFNTGADSGRQHFYSRNGRHDSVNRMTWSSANVHHENSAFIEGEDFVPGQWERVSEQGVVLHVSTPVRNGAEFSIEATPDVKIGPFFPLTLISSAPYDEFSGVPFQVSSGTQHEFSVYMRPSSWTTEPDLTVEKPDFRGECWVEVEYYTGSGSNRKSRMKYSFRESQTVLANDTWSAVKVSNVIPGEDGWALVRAFLGKEDGGAEVLYVDPNVLVN